MIYTVIAAGGIGSRMGNVETPKQYLKINNKPIIVHTAEKFHMNKRVEKVIILCPESWVNYTQSMIKEYFSNDEKIVVIQGGETRNDTIMNAIDYIEKTDGLDDDTIILTHDAVRPFVTQRIIEQNIDSAIKYGATGTVVPATDTIIQSEDGKIISQIPDRSKLYQAQTPQTFKAKLLKQLCESLSVEEKLILTDACKIFSLKGHDVHMIEGDVQNIKITYQYDLKVAQILIEE